MILLKVVRLLFEIDATCDPLDLAGTEFPAAKRVSIRVPMDDHGSVWTRSVQ